jgi:hypothetical protein
MEDTISKCSCCGSNQFHQICENCGNHFQGNKCSKCGVLVGQKPRICTKCGGKAYNNICPTCGDDILNKDEKINISNTSSQRINYTLQSNSNQATVNVPNKKYKHATYKSENKRKKLGCSSVIWFFLIIGFVISLNQYTEKDNVEQTKNLEVNQETNLEMTDKELLTLEGHPILYDDYEEAKGFWKEYDKVMFLDADSIKDHRNELLILCENNDRIDNIRIKLTNNNNQKVTINDIVMISRTYIPSKLIEKYYEYDRSFFETKDGEGKEVYYYAWKMNEEGKLAKKDKAFNFMKAKIAIRITHLIESDEWVVEINETVKGLHEKKGSSGYTVKDWTF